MSILEIGNWSCSPLEKSWDLSSTAFSFPAFGEILELLLGATATFDTLGVDCDAVSTVPGRPELEVGPGCSTVDVTLG